MDTELAPDTVSAMEAVFGTDAPAEPATSETDAAQKEQAPATKPEPPKADERVAARILAAQKADERAAKNRAEIAAQKAELDKQRGELAELAKIAELVKASKASPSKALELLGYEPRAFLETLATEHEPAAVAARVASEGRSEVEKLRAEVEAMRKEREAAERAAKDREMEEGATQSVRLFVDHVANNAAKYPHLVDEFTPDEIAKHGWDLAMKHSAGFEAEFGRPPNDEEIADHLEEMAKQRAEQRTAWRTRIGKSAPNSSAASTGEIRAAQPENQGQSPRTLTSRVTSVKASAPKPWSQELADEESMKVLSQAFGK